MQVAHSLTSIRKLRFLSAFLNSSRQIHWEGDVGSREVLRAFHLKY